MFARALQFRRAIPLLAATVACTAYIANKKAENYFPTEKIQFKDDEIFTPYNYVLKHSPSTYSRPYNLDKYLDPYYQPEGHVHKFSNRLQFYCTGSTESKRAIILIPDIFGWNSGRTRKIADYLASQGYYVMVPRLITPTAYKHKEDESIFPSIFDFKKTGDFLKNLAFDHQLKPMLELLIEHCSKCGISDLNLFSFGWGSWVAAQALACEEINDCFNCGVLVSPSVTVEKSVFGGSTTKLMKSIKKPVLLIPTSQESDDYRIDGKYYEAVKNRNPGTDILDLHEVPHGFLPRGDIGEFENYKAINMTMGKTLQFLKKFNN